MFSVLGVRDKRCHHCVTGHSNAVWCDSESSVVLFSNMEFLGYLGKDVLSITVRPGGCLSTQLLEYGKMCWKNGSAYLIRWSFWCDYQWNVCRTWTDILSIFVIFLFRSSAVPTLSITSLTMHCGWAFTKQKISRQIYRLDGCVLLLLIKTTFMKKFVQA